MTAKAPPLKILMVITTLDMGGAEKHLLLLCRGLIEKGHSVAAAFLKGKGSLGADFESLGASVVKIPLESAAGLPAAVLNLSRKIRTGGFDLVHSHLLKADALSSLACCAGQGRRAILVSSKHNDERPLQKPWIGIAHGWLSRRARRVIVLSDHVGRYMQRFGRVDPAKITRIYYGLDAAAFADPGAGAVERARAELRLDPGAPMLTMVARFAPQKDHASLLRAARLLKEEGRLFRLLLVGGDPFGSHQREAEALCAELGIRDVVTFAGIRKDVPALLGLTDIFVMPSFWEGLGLVFLEAMAFSLPVVACRVSAVPEVVRHGETGLLVPPGDPQGLKAALARLLDQPEEAKAFGKAGRLLLEERFGWKRMVEETERVYLEVIAGCGR